MGNEEDFENSLLHSSFAKMILLKAGLMMVNVKLKNLVLSLPIDKKYALSQQSAVRHSSISMAVLIWQPFLHSAMFSKCAKSMAGLAPQEILTIHTPDNT